MADTTEKKNAARTHTSYVGTFKEGSFSVTDGVASATLVDVNDKEHALKGYKDHAKTLEDAVAAGGEVIVRGAILGAGGTTHLAVYGTGPEHVVGKVSNVRDNFDSFEAKGKMPFVNAFVLVERGEHKIPTPVTAFGDEALALRGLKAGDRLEVDARQTQESREVKNKETGEKETKWVPVMRVVSNASFEPAAEKEEDSSPSM